MKVEVDKYRVKDGIWKTKDGEKMGMFNIPSPTCNRVLKVVCANMENEWQHVSVSLENRCPNWEEMSYIKDLFWSNGETVVQFHPKKSEYVNNHPYVLHLWKKKDKEFELPPSILVGVKEAGDLTS